eukprot:1651656-Rhodomonas_salina.1
MAIPDGTAVRVLRQGRRYPHLGRTPGMLLPYALRRAANTATGYCPTPSLVLTRRMAIRQYGFETNWLRLWALNSYQGSVGAENIPEVPAPLPPTLCPSTSSALYPATSYAVSRYLLRCISLPPTSLLRFVLRCISCAIAYAWLRASGYRAGLSCYSGV